MRRALPIAFTQASLRPVVVRPLAAAIAALVMLPVPSPAAGKEPTRNIPLGTYRLQVSLSYRAQASNDSLVNHPAASGGGPASYWNFTAQSESANVSASWSDELKLTKTAEGSHDFSVLPVNFTHADGELHDIEYHALGSAGTNASVSDSYTGTYYSLEEPTCTETCPPTNYRPIPFTCTASYSGAQLDPDLVVEWEGKTDVEKLQHNGYFDPTRPGAEMLGASFLLGSELADQAKVRQAGETPNGVVSPNCPADVYPFEPWSADEALLSSDYRNQTGPASRAVYFPLDTLIHKGRASGTFTGLVLSPTGCCTGTTKMSLTMTATKLR